MTRPWLPPSAVTVPDALREVVAGHPLVAETLARRGYADVTRRHAPSSILPPTRRPPSALPGMARAITRLGRAIRAREPICVWGDFDVDGQTATALLVVLPRGPGRIRHLPRTEPRNRGPRHRPACATGSHRGRGAADPDVRHRHRGPRAGRLRAGQGVE